jgi:hypothetical protein
MIRDTSLVFAALFTVIAPIATAQQPPRPSDSSRAVTLSLAEYNRLTDLANRPPPGVPPPPVAAVLSGADLRVRVERDTARGVFALTGEVLRPGVSRVDLIAGATLTEASVSGRALPLLADGNAHAALVPGPGVFALSLDWGAPLAFAPGRASFVLPVPKSGTARATFDLPGDQADVHLSAGLITRKTVVADRTIVEATLDPGTATEVWWSMRDSAPAAAARDLRMLADVMTLVTLGDSDVRMAALIDVTVVQGDARTIEAHVPQGYEVTGISGSTLESSDARDSSVVLRIGDAAARRHQFLISLERPHNAGSFTLDTAVVTLPEAQRERGEIAVEGVGTLELAATERDGMHRLDVRELNPTLQSMARLPMLAAFRYQRSAAATTGLTLDVKRFADSGVLAAVAERAVATTLVTREGRTLTEIALTIQNRAQKFLKVTLPAGASIVSVDVAGEPAKPVTGSDGTRVPLLRPGLRAGGAYQVTFVYLYGGTPFGKKGNLQMTLPRMDVPVGVVEWEVFVPEGYSVRAIDGNVIERRAMVVASPKGMPGIAAVGGRPAENMPISNVRITAATNATPGQIRGRATDNSGSVLPGTEILLEAGNVHRSAVTDANGMFTIADVPAGYVAMSAKLAGFVTATAGFVFDRQPRHVEFVLHVAALTETVTVTAETPRTDQAHDRAMQQSQAPSQNVINLQRRTAGVLPVRIDVPRTGTSHEFIKPLVVDHETAVTFRYARR